MENPWSIHSIYDLQYFNCPECVFKNNSKQEFINHAYKVHPDCVYYLDKIDDNSLIDILCPWLTPQIKIEEPEDILDPIKMEISNSDKFEICKNEFGYENNDATKQDGHSALLKIQGKCLLESVGEAHNDVHRRSRHLQETQSKDNTIKVG